MATRDVQFDLSSREKELVLKRAALKQSLKTEYMKKSTNPLRWGQPGHLFDPAIQRWLSMKATRIDHFRPTMAGFGRLLLTHVLPIGLFAYYLRKSRKNFDRKCRNGEITYRERNFKFIS